MNLVELELDETLADFEVQDWIDNVFSVQYPDIKARIKKGCSGLCHKKDEWHYVKDGKDLPLDAGLHIRVVLHNGNEYICETDYYEPSEDEIGFGHLLIQLYSNDEWIDENDVYAWCELSMPPKKE